MEVYQRIASNSSKASLFAALGIFNVKLRSTTVLSADCDDVALNVYVVTGVVGVTLTTTGVSGASNGSVFL